MNYRHRVYVPQLGRFGSRDPVGYAAGVNLIEYVWDSPVNLCDPFGLQSNVLTLPQMLAAGWTAEEIAAALGISVKAAAGLIAAYKLEQAVEKLVENYQHNAKGKDACALALNAMAQAVKAIQSLEAIIRQHEQWIRDPSSYPGTVRNVENARRAWQRDINRARNNIAKNRKALEKLRELAKKACRCWWKPWRKPWKDFDNWIPGK